jgi:hypothetical protein
METRKFGEARPRKLDNPKFKEEEENLRKRFTEQVKVEEQRFRQWEQKLISERDRLNKDLEATHAAYVSVSPNHTIFDPTKTNLTFLGLQDQIARAGNRGPAGLRHSQPWSSLSFSSGKRPGFFKKGVVQATQASSLFSSLEYPMSCRSRAWEGAPSPEGRGWFILFCYIHLPLVASDGVYILDNNPSCIL